VTQQTGMIRVFVGPMGAGKTTALLNWYGVTGMMDVRTMLVKHDDGAAEHPLVLETHAGTRVVADAVVGDCDLLRAVYGVFDLSKPGRTAVFIDEGHFYANLPNVVETMALNGTDVFVAALDCDSARHPFQNIAELCARADVVDKMHGTCDRCSKASQYSYRRKKAPPQTAQCSVGGFDVYGALCRHCYREFVDGATGVEC